jgi:hypothetical protein
VRRAISISPPIVLALILLPVIAFAIPADASWIAGVYDGADGDDIVSLVYETSAANMGSPSHLGPLSCLLEMFLENSGRNVPDRYFTRGPRSPPVLCSFEFTHVFNSFAFSCFRDGRFRQPPGDHEFPLSPPDDLPVLCLSEARRRPGWQVPLEIGGDGADGYLHAARGRWPAHLISRADDGSTYVELTSAR